MTTPRKTLAENVLKLRQHHGWSQPELARKSGIPQTTISSIERAVHNAGVDAIEALAAAFKVPHWMLMMPNVTVDVLLSGSMPKLMEHYAKMDEQGRNLVSMVAERESDYRRR